jgi:hypothetical protein
MIPILKRNARCPILGFQLWHFAIFMLRQIALCQIKESGKARMTPQEFAATGYPESMQNTFAAPTPHVNSTVLNARSGVLRGRRRITREAGRALECIGHAADYLLDGYIQHGPARELLHGHSAEMEAIRLLVQARNRILESLEIVEPVHRRFWNAVLRRRPVPTMVSLGLQ